MIKWHFYEAWMVLELGYLLQRYPGNQAYLVLLAMFMNLRKAQKSIKDLTICLCYFVMI